jgi:hypothetical protein
VQEAVDNVVRLMLLDVAAATSVAVLSAAVAVRVHLAAATSVGLAYAAAAVFGRGTLASILNQRVQAGTLESALRELDCETKSAQDSVA